MKVKSGGGPLLFFRRSIFLFAIRHDLVCFRLRNPFVKIFVDHEHRGRAATGQALDKLDRKFAVLGGLQAVFRNVQTKFPADMIPQFMAAAQCATQSPANLDVVPARRRLPEHGIKRHQFVNIDRLQAELFGDPVHRLG